LATEACPQGPEHGQAGEGDAAGRAIRIEDLRFRGEPLPGQDALFVRVVVSGPGGQTLYDQAVRDDPAGLEAGTRGVVEATEVEAGSVEVKVADLIADARRKWQHDRDQQRAAPEDAAVGLVDLATFMKQQDKEEWLVTQLLVAREPIILGGPKKAHKTSLAIDLALSLGSGTPFLGAFPVPRRVRTAVFSGESSPGTIRRLVRRICQSRHIAPEACDVRLSPRLPRLSNPGSLKQLNTYLRGEGVGVVMIDPVYLCLLQSGVAVSAANLFQVGPLLLDISAACLDAGATPILVHHARKESLTRKTAHNEPLDLDDLAFAGFAEFARQWVLVNRRERFDPAKGSQKLWLSVGGSAGQSGLWGIDIEEGRLGEDFGGRYWRLRVLDGHDLQREVIAAKQMRKIEKAEEDQQRARRQVGQLLLKRATAATISEIRGLTGLPRNRVMEAVNYFHQVRAVIPAKVRRKAGRAGTREYDGWRATPAILQQLRPTTPSEEPQEGVPRPIGAARVIVAAATAVAPAAQRGTRRRGRRLRPPPHLRSRNSRPRRANDKEERRARAGPTADAPDLAGRPGGRRSLRPPRTARPGRRRPLQLGAFLSPE
jgi:replicative DNA helicase